VGKILPTIFPAPLVILSKSIPHHYRYEQHLQVIKQCANIVAQFLDGMQILTYIYTHTYASYYISELWCLHCNSDIKPNMFQTVWLISTGLLSFSFMFLKDPLQKNKKKPSKAPNDKPNSLKHVRHSVPKLQ
jgi:hypothetical protein